MSDLLLLGGVALCLLSVVVAIVQLFQTRPPRAAAIMLVLGFALIFAAAYLGPQPFSLEHVAQAWERVSGAAPARP